MRLIPHCLYVLLLAGSLSIPGVSGQENISVRHGPYEVFYSAFNTTFLATDVASTLKIVRAKDRGLINISVRKDDLEGGNTAVAVHDITGSIFDLVHRKSLTFREVQEPDAIYYLAEFPINHNHETLVFEIRVKPGPDTDVIPLSFKRIFYLDE